MSSANCLACGAKLAFSSNKEAKCTNPNCPGGGKYVKCGFCKEFTFATRYTSQMACVNRRCRMYNRVREICSACKKASFIDFNGRQVCINRNCPTNSHVIDMCFFCKNTAFLNDEALMFCTKGDCSFLLYEVRHCDICNERTYLVHAKSCQNTECQYYNVTVEQCPNCGRKTVVPDSASPNGKKCVSPDCAKLAAVDMAEMTLDSIDVSELRKMEAAPQPKPAPQKPPAAAKPAPKPAAKTPPPPAYEEQDTPSPPEDFMPEPEEAPVEPAPASNPEEELAPRSREKAKDRDTVAFRRAGEAASIPTPHDEIGEDDIVIEDAPPPKREPAKKPQPVPAEPDDAPIIEDESGGDFTPADESGEEIFSFDGATPPGKKEPETVEAPKPPAKTDARAPQDARQGKTSARTPAPAPRQPEPVEPAREDSDAGFAEDEPAPAPAPAPKPKASVFASESLVEDDDEDAVIIEGKPAAKPAAKAAPAAEQKPAPHAQPGPVQQPSPATAMHHSPFDKSTPLTRVFRFLSDYVLKDERGMNYPLFLIIGLAGSGKTNYLTVLGDLLNKRELNYYFPYEGIDIKPVRVDKIVQQNPDKFRAAFGANFEHEIKSQIQDLVYSYSSRQFSEFIANTVWPPFTPPEEGSTYFLLTEITRKQRTIAKIATLETSGETFEEIIRGMSGGKLELSADNPLQRVVHELLDVAEGYVILIDPAKKDNDDIYEHLFLALKQGVEPRAMNLFYKKVREKIMEKTGRKAGGVMDMIEGYMEAEKDKQKLNEAVKARGLRLKNELTPLFEKLSQPDTDIREFYTEHIEALNRLQDIIKERFPDVYEKASRKVQEKAEEKEGPKFDLFRDFLQNMIKFATDMKNLPDIARFLYAADLRKAEAQALADQQTNEDKVEIAGHVMQNLGVELNVEIDPELPESREVVRFKNLKHLAIAVTKTDMYPIIYPPEEYPRKKLPRCDRRLRELNELLKMLGGGTRYYNTSATGYSVLKDTMFMPGHKNTLTPINVIEPIFDMLNI